MTHISTEQDPTSTTPHAGRYRIDPSRSTVAFKTRHVAGPYIDITAEVRCVRT